MRGAADIAAPAVGARDASAPRDVAAAVRGAEGVAVVRGALEADELRRVRGLIEAQWLARLEARAAEHAKTFRERGIERYHELSHLVDHASLWPKSARILGAEAVAAIRATTLCRRLEEAFGPFAISDEERLGREEIYWRIVRPCGGGEPAASHDAAARDTGPVHADRWFWDLGHGTTPAGMERVKVWAAVVTEPGQSGLRVLPGSHLRRWRYHGETRDGFVKPVIDEDVGALGLSLVSTEPGDAVVFHDALLHGGGASRGAWTRVSFEFTMFVRPPRA